MQIVPAQMSQKAALEALQMRASLEWEEYRAALLANPEVVEVPADQISNEGVLVAIDRGAPTGFVALRSREDGNAELDGLFVEPASWGRKIGTELVKAAEALALQMGCATVHVVANPRAEGFYQRCGFERCGDSETQFGPAALMKKRIG